MLDTHQVFSGLKVAGKAAGRCATIQIVGSEVLTTSSKASIVGTLDEPFRPVAPVRAIFGVDGGAWGIASIEPDGRIGVIHRFGSASSKVWSYVDISLTFAVQG